MDNLTKISFRIAHENRVDLRYRCSAKVDDEERLHEKDCRSCAFVIRDAMKFMRSEIVNKAHEHAAVARVRGLAAMQDRSSKALDGASQALATFAATLKD